MRNISVIMFILLVAVSYGFYQLQHQVEVKQDRVAALEQQLKTDSETIKILEAEWALLSNPKRLQQLSNRFLELAPIAPSQIREVDDLAMREETIEGAAFIDRQTEPQTPVVAVAELPKSLKTNLPVIPVVNRGVAP